MDDQPQMTQDKLNALSNSMPIIPERKDDIFIKVQEFSNKGTGSVIVASSQLVEGREYDLVYEDGEKGKCVCAMSVDCCVDCTGCPLCSDGGKKRSRRSTIGGGVESSGVRKTMLVLNKTKLMEKMKMLSKESAKSIINKIVVPLEKAIESETTMVKNDPNISPDAKKVALEVLTITDTLFQAIGKLTS